MDRLQNTVSFKKTAECASVRLHEQNAGLLLYLNKSGLQNLSFFSCDL